MNRVMHLVLAAALAGCAQTTTTSPPAEDAGGGRCTLAFAGDPNAAPVIELTSMGPDGDIRTLDEGAMVPLMNPPQGGRVAFVGVRARNVDPCTVELSGALRDPVSGQVRVEVRTLNLRPDPADSSTVQSAPGVINTWANIPICPNQWAGQDAYGESFELVVSMKERSGREFMRTLHVTPYCAEPELEAHCRCICSQGYMLGQTCELPDGGEPVDAGPTSDGGA